MAKILGTSIKSITVVLVGKAFVMIVQQNAYPYQNEAGVKILSGYVMNVRRSTKLSIKFFASRIA